MKTNIRLFVALEIPEKVKREIIGIATKLKEQKFSEEISFVQYENLHITLQFLGLINDKLQPDICQALRKIKIPSFEVFINNLGVNNKTYLI